VAARRVTSLVILGAFLALAILAFLGNLVLGAIFIVVAGAVLARSRFRLCPRCSNMACAFNPRAPKSEMPDWDCADAQGFSDLPITRNTVLPLLLAGPLAFVAAWLYNPYAAVAVGVVALAAHTVFRKLTCSQCGNDCAGNCNPAYRAWKAAQRESGS
jgi:hypothetical protein